MKVYKFQLKPNKHQQKKLHETLDSCRFTYNQLLEKLNKQTEINKTEIQHYIVELKEQYPFLKQVYSKTLQYECYRLFSNLSSLVSSKKKGRKVGKLRFKGCNWFKTVCYNQSGFKLIQTNKHYTKLRLSKIGDINIVQHRIVKGVVKGIIIKKKVNGWEAHIISDEENVIKPKPKINTISKEIGIDLGVLSFLHASSNEIVKNPLYMNKQLAKLQYVHRRISKTKKGSHNRKKKCNHLKRVWEKIDNQKKDFFHKVSTYLVTTYNFIAVEKLNIKSMTSNKKNKYYNHRNILDSSWGMFLQMLKIKAGSAGIEHVEVNPMNTSKMCCKCGKLKEMPTNVRTYNCECGMSIDRDYNASINILAKGKGLTFVGEDWLQSLMNQEAITLNL